MKTRYQYMRFIQLAGIGNTTHWSCLDTKYREFGVIKWDDLQRQYCYSHTAKQELGGIKWDDKQRKYCYSRTAFFPSYTKGHLKDIAAFITTLMKKNNADFITTLMQKNKGKIK